MTSKYKNFKLINPALKDAKYLYINTQKKS